MESITGDPSADLSLGLRCLQAEQRMKLISDATVQPSHISHLIHLHFHTFNSRPTSLLPIIHNCGFELCQTRVQSKHLRYLAIPAVRTGLTLAAAELAEKAPRTTSGLSA